MDDLVTRFRRAAETFGARIHEVAPGQWSAPTPCTEWDVRALCNHVVGEAAWMVPLFAGKTIAEVGGALDGDILGEDPARAWDEAIESALAAVQEPGAMEQIVHLSFGDVLGEEYLRQVHADVVIHTWDLATAIGADRTIDAIEAQALIEYLEPMLKGNTGGAFAAPVEIGPDAGAADRLIALTGRDPR